jgi:hypothetical protein
MIDTKRLVRLGDETAQECLTRGISLVQVHIMKQSHINNK